MEKRSEQTFLQRRYNSGQIYTLKNAKHFYPLGNVNRKHNEI